MPVTRVTRTLAVPRETLWDLLADPYHQARWWPRVRRMEVSQDGRFTQVLTSNRGRGVRLDFHVVSVEAPRRLRWEQQLQDTPFERLVAEAITEIELEEGPDGGTAVTIVLRRRLRGWSRFAGFLFRRAARAQLREALDGLARISEA
jgi:uncharacterized protein YndB with AHSA1/START domain